MSCKKCEKKVGCYALTWKIENFSRYMATEDSSLRSPAWKTESTDGNTWWSLDAFYLSSKLTFGLICLGGEHQRYFSRIMECEMHLLASSGEFPLRYKFTDYASCYYIEENSIFSENRKSEIIPQDTLILCCRIRKEMIKPGQCLLQTVLHEVDYILSIGYFDLVLSQTNYFVHQQDNVLLFISFLKSSGDKGSHTVKIDLQTSLGRSAYFVNCKISANNSDGRFIRSENDAYPCVSLSWDIHIKTSNFPLKLESLVAEHMEPQVSSDKVQGSSSRLDDDLLILYREGTLSDLTLNTVGKSIQAHRSILAARSSVFRAMFEKKETTEGQSGVVDIDDINGETMDRLLVFLYGDSLEDLQWEEASELYYAADKYDVQPLKQQCVDILKAGLDVDKACDALVLADRHSDDELIEFVVDFIRDHEYVIDLSDWAKLEEDNPRLTTKVLRQVIRKKN